MMGEVVGLLIGCGLAFSVWGLILNSWSSKDIEELEKELQDCKKRLTELEEKTK